MCSVLDAKLHASNPVPPSLLRQPSPRAESAAPECEPAPEPIDDLYAMKLARERLHDSLRQLEPLAHVIEELGERVRAAPLSIRFQISYTRTVVSSVLSNLLHITSE